MSNVIVQQVLYLFEYQVLTIIRRGPVLPKKKKMFMHYYKAREETFI